MKKRYLSEIIGEEYKYWENKKILITAPTGMGKTSFILEKVLPYHNGRNRKILILCNRKLLRKQYLCALVRKFNCYSELCKSVKVMTYQQLAENIKNGTHKEVLDEFRVICLDECHFFYADSDFNGFGTFILLQVLISECIRKQMIFMSATMDEVKPLIENTINQCISKIRVGSKFEENCSGFRIIKEYDYAELADFQRVNCVYVPDVETLCGILASSDKKTIIFVDDKSMAEDMYQKFTRVLGVEKGRIAVLNADNLEDIDNSRVVEYLVMSNRLSVKILITTSVLDNGVSIHDEEVENLVIITNSKISFLQMLGRVRAESVDNLKLYFLQRQPEVFARREIRLVKTIEEIEKAEKNNCDRLRFNYLQTVWENSNPELAAIYKQILVWAKSEYNLFYNHSENVYVRYGNCSLCVNCFAKEKIGDVYLITARMHALAMDSPIRVVEEQMSWIGKEAQKLVVLNSTYEEKQLQVMKEELLRVKGFPLNDLKVFKESFCEKYRKEFFADIVVKNGSFSTEKLKKILEKFDLQLEISCEGDGTKRYSIVEKEESLC